MIFWTHTLISEETSQLRPVFYTDAPRNLQNISDPELDALMDEDAVTNPNDPRKEEICMRIQEIIYDYLPCINMYYPRNTFAFKNTVGGAIYYTVSLDWRYAYRVAVD